MKKFFALALSALMAVSAIPVSAEPASSLPDLEWAQARPVSAQELAQVRNKDFDRDPQVPETGTQETEDYITDLTVTEAVMTQADAAPRASDLLPAPVLAHITATTIIFEKVEGYDYYVRGGHYVYQSASNVFSKMVPNTEYECYLTLPGDNRPVSETLTVTTTDRVPCPDTPAAPMIAEYTEHTIALVRREGYEYRINDGEWVNYYVFSDLEPDTEYTFYQRIAQTKQELASEASEPLTFKTASYGPSCLTNVSQLLEYINTNGFEDEDGNKVLAYVLTDELGTEYYFLMINRKNYVDFDVFSYSDESDVLLFDTQFSVGSYYTSTFLEFTAALYSGEECVDYVVNYQYLDLDKYHIGDTLKVENAGDYLQLSDLSTLCTMSTQMLFGFWDEYIYNALGFGFRGLGFVVTEGYGDLFCNPALEAHFGETVVKFQREGDCLANGCEGVYYCTLCGRQITDYYGTTARGYHVYDNDCDVDCNDCGAIRSVPHHYSFACDTQCDVCGTVRTTPLAAHSLNADRICAKCGQTVMLPGDASGDGKVTMGDVAKVYAHTRGTALLTDSNALAAADVSGDGKINLGDVSRIIAHVSGSKLLW